MHIYLNYFNAIFHIIYLNKLWELHDLIHTVVYVFIEMLMISNVVLEFVLLPLLLVKKNSRKMDNYFTHLIIYNSFVLYYNYTIIARCIGVER